MTDRELMQQALDYLDAPSSKVWAAGTEYKIIQALRARLAQPEHEPVACIVKGCSNHKHEGKFVGDLCSPCRTFITTGEGKYSQAYRNSQREWQGLTDEERDEIAIIAQYDPLRMTVYEYRVAIQIAIEAKLKEKNT